jgi:hypothetical protein
MTKKIGSSDCRSTSYLLYLLEGNASLKPSMKELSYEQVEIYGNQA